MLVTIPIADVMTKDADGLSHLFRSFGGTNVRVGDRMTFPFSNSGEMIFSPDMYALCKSHPEWNIEDALMYKVFTADEIEQTVPDNWPDAEGEDGLKTVAEYFRQGTQYLLDDGTWLFRIVRQGLDLSDADRRVYEDDIGPLLVRAEGVPMIPKTVTP